jgi:ElaA protein
MITWHCKRFETLSNVELYSILKLRSAVFVVEQNCVFLEPDGPIDFVANHFFAKENNEIIAYCRLIPPGAAYEQASIGRVLTHGQARGKNMGKKLVQKALDYCTQLFGKVPIKIGAQYYLKKFYEAFGFMQIGNVYIEDGIEHIYMIRIND